MNKTRRLKPKELEQYRNDLLVKQNYICPLCETEIAPDEAVLDHLHGGTGNIRSVLHRSCNASEGRILNFAEKRCRSDDALKFIKNLVKYWEADFTDNPIHPSERIPEEKERLKLKRKLKKLKSKSHIEKTKQEIKRLNQVIKEKLGE